jgi:hypothetical protein
MAEGYANLGCFGMTSVKPFGILVEGWGEGVAREVRLPPTPRESKEPHSRGRLRSTVIAGVYANLEWLGMGPYKPFGILVGAWGEGLPRSGDRRDRGIW